MIKAEYQRFLQTLNLDEVPTEVRKLANLVLANLEELTALGTHQGQRVKRLVPLAQTNWDTLAPDIQPLTVLDNQQTFPITQLKSMKVGPFRGFAKQEFFDLESRLVLIYGPNGTGKSSFCEALEYGLLGNVAEAESKRFRDQRNYLKNVHVNRFAEPEILGMDVLGSEVAIAPDEQLYRFCFVEKNRIDNFSRIAAQTPSKQTELISTLFGLDSFNEFVRNFSTEIDIKYIDLVGVKSLQLEKKRQALIVDQQLIEANNTELKKLDVEEQTLAFQYREGYTFSQMFFDLNGDEQNTGAIQQLETLLQQPLANKSTLTVAALQTVTNSISTGISELATKNQELASASQQVSFQKLYESVIQLQPSNPEHCPACKTPLSHVAVNPYIHASEELQRLQYLAILQQKVQQEQQKISQLLQELSLILNNCVILLPQNNVLQNYKVPIGTQANIEWWNILQRQMQDSFTPWQHIHTQVNQLEEADKAIDLAIQNRVNQQAELNRLRGIKDKITVLQTRRNTAQQGVVAAQKAIADFNSENAQLLADVNVEKVAVVKNNLIADSYRKFVAMLNNYIDRLPGLLVADLGDLVVTLYNAFNRYDAAEDKLYSVQLPLSQNQQLRIAYDRNSASSFDALQVLSEGHIRCLGLSILLAKNIKEHCPILVFDDPINAIDDEHRRAIRETLFVDEFFSNSQIVLAIHGEEFFNSTHQLLGKKRAFDSESYVFLSATGENHIQIDSLKRPKNYVLAARELHGQGEYRDALMSARRALENLCERAWHHYGRHSDKQDGLISVSRRSPSMPWDLRALAENLKSKINRSRAVIPNKEPIVAALTSVLGQDGKNTYWVYLNKGTHDETDLPEFDHHTVHEVIASLESLDSALS